MKEQISMSLPVVHAYSAGIDAGSRSHFVAVGQEKDDVSEFGIYDKDLRTCAGWLKSFGITPRSTQRKGQGNHIRNKNHRNQNTDKLHTYVAHAYIR